MKTNARKRARVIVIVIKKRSCRRHGRRSPDYFYPDASAEVRRTMMFITIFIAFPCVGPAANYHGIVFFCFRLNGFLFYYYHRYYYATEDCV